jgi:malate synthase
VAQSFSSAKTNIMGDSMRDIRADLQDRANFLKEQMSAAQAQFDKHVDQIKREHDSKLKDLRADLDAVTTLLGAEQRRLGNAPTVPNAQPEGQEPKPQQPHAHEARRPMRLADMIGLQRAG